MPNVNVAIRSCREREPWGPGSWYAEVIDTLTRAVLLTTDYGPRSLIIRTAEQEARAKGFNVVAVAH